VAATTAELYTVVENMTGAERTFPFLGAHGMRLGVGEIVAIPGDLVATLGASRYQRKFKGLESALARGLLRIRSRPTPILYDDVLEQPKALAIRNGALGIVDPTYESSASDSFAAV
jgi:hypothetical protein